MPDSTSDHRFTATFDDRLLTLFERTFRFDGPITIETTEDALTVGRVHRGSVFSVAVTIDADAFETYQHTTAGTTLVRGGSFDGVVDILRGLGFDSDNSFTLDVDPERLAFHHADSMHGGEMPREDNCSKPPDVGDFADELTCESTVRSPAAVDSLYISADCHGENSPAELRAVDGEAYLTMVGQDPKYAELGDADHPNGETTRAIFDAEYVNTAFESFVHYNNPTTLRWGPDHPLVLEMTTENRDYQAVVAPRIYDDPDEEPDYEAATELDSVGAAVAGGFQ